MNRNTEGGGGGMRWDAAVALALACVAAAGCGPQGAGGPAGEITLAPPTREVLFRTGVSDAADPLQAGKAAAQAARDQLGEAPLRAVIVSECYEDADRKAKVLEGVCSAFPKELVYGAATYGSFTQAGVGGGESVAVLAIAGSDVAVDAACQEDLGTANLTPAEHQAEIDAKLRPAGAALAGKLPRTPRSRLMIVLADAHSPKNGSLVAGVRQAAGSDFPITGGSANKNAGQTFVYFQGRMLRDAAVGLMLSGDFQVALAGRQAKENDQVIATARQAAAEALGRLGKAGARPAAALAFDCAGRKGKLKNVADELAAMQRSLGRELPLFGTYNAGEIGPADLAEKEPGVLSSGVGWHVMFTVLGW